MNADFGRIILAALVVVGLGEARIAVAQDTFQWEAELSYGRQSFDGGRIDYPVAGATFFFEKLPLPKDYPLEEAAFVERIGSIGVQYTRLIFNIDSLETHSDGSFPSANVLIRHPDTPFFADFTYYSYRSGKSRFTSPGQFVETESRGSVYQLSAGAYVDKTTAVSLDLSKAKFTFTSTTNLGSSESRDSSDAIGLSARHLARLPNGDHLAFLAGASQTKDQREGAASEKSRGFFLQGTYYPTNTLALELLISINRGDDSSSEGETYGAGVRNFFTPTFGMALAFQRSYYKSPTTLDADFVELSARFRF